jgi:rod shape-determining protein MreC
MRNPRRPPRQRDLPIFILLVILSVSILALDRVTDINPVAGVLARIFIPFEDLSSRLMNLTFLYRENQILRGKLVEMSRENMVLREKAHEISRLRRLLDFRTVYPDMLEASRVVGEFDERMGGGIIIDKGTEAGFRKSMPVMCPDGLVGRIMNVGTGFSTVKRIVDPGNRVSASLQRSRATGILSSRSDGTLFMEWVPPDADVAPGDTVISSGLGSVMPKGLLIGTVRTIKEKPERFSLSLEVLPSTDFNRLEEVFVIMTQYPQFQSEPGEAEGQEVER